MKFYIKCSQPIKHVATTVFLCSFFWGCSGSSENESPKGDGWRRGVLNVEFVLQQSTVHSEETLDEDTNELNDQTDITWSYSLAATSTQKVWLLNDLTVFMPSGSDEERYESMTTPPYYVEEDTQAEVSGSLDYRIDIQSHTPNALSSEYFNKKTSGQAAIESFTINNLLPSLFGDGYEFALELGFTYEQSGKTILTRADGLDTELDDNKTQKQDMTFYFYPPLNQEALNDYPYIYEYNDIEDQDVLDGIKEAELEKFSYLKSIEDKTVSSNYANYVGVITKRSRDTLIIEYTFTGEMMLPLAGDFTALDAVSDDNQLTVKVTLRAD